MAIVGLETILANQGAVTDTQSSSSTSASSKDQFFKLLVTQLQYQDPLNPVENTEFTAQLAQFTTLELMENQNNTMEEILQLQGSMNNMQTLSFIGKQVSGTGNIVNYTGEEVTLNFELEDSASDVTISIYTDEGTLVRTLEMSDVPGGDVQSVWDGRNNVGEEVSAGRYAFTIEATDQDGLAVSGKTYTTGAVTGVRYDGGITYLIIGDKEITISDVEKIIG